MSGDISRSTFDPQKHYKGVLEQQGRVHLDADWNEEVNITNHRLETETKDTIGACGTPIDGDGNANGFKLTIKNGDINIGAGRFYVDGLLCENDADENETGILYKDQLDLKELPDIPAGLSLAYLDVWEREITALEDDSIREKALGGPDTATRVKTVWQVKLKTLKNDTFNCSTAPLPSDESTGYLSARAQPDAKAKDDCEVPPNAGYRRLENQLYRVEIHAGSDPDDPNTVPTFKWSRDNGSVVVAVVKNGFKIDNNTKKIKVASLGRDDVLGLHKNDWVEVLDDKCELDGKPGTLARISDIHPDNNVLELSKDVAEYKNEYHPKVRRWDSDGEIKINDTTNYIDLEDGIQIKFEPGQYNTGDYWLIPARTITGDIEWPKDDNGNPKPKPKQGIYHHYCKLGLVNKNNGTLEITDCRSQFPALTDLTCLYYVSGDGQEAMPGGGLPQPLQAGVSNGKWPVKDARVRFEIISGNGTLSSGGNPGPFVDVITKEDGIASCDWTLDNDTYSQRLKATLLDVANKPLHLPLFYNANLSLASQVAYSTDCHGLEKADTVQEAIDALCARENEYLTLRYVGGDGQEGLPGSQLPAELIVAVENVLGEPKSGVAVAFEIITSAPATTVGTLTSTSVTTDLNGEAKVGWILGSTAGLNLVQASLDTPQPGTPKVIFNARGAVPTTKGGLCTITVGDGKISHGEFDGAKGLQEAINKVCEQGGGTICVLRGTYEIEVPIHAQGCQNLIIHGNRLETWLEGNQSVLMRFRECLGIELYDLQIAALDAGSNQFSGLVTFEACDGIVMDSCLIRGSGINLNNLTCLLIVDSPPSSISVPTALIRNCQFIAEGRGRINGISLRRVHEACVKDCMIQIFTMSGGYGIDLDEDCDTCLISGNKIRAIPPTDMDDKGASLGGIHVGSGCDEVVVCNNHILGGAGFGIGLGSVTKKGASLGGLRALTIEGNLIREMAKSGIGVLEFTYNEKTGQILQPVTNDLLVRANRIEYCAYGNSSMIKTVETVFFQFPIPGHRITVTNQYRLGAGIALWMGEGIRLVDNVIQDNGHFDQEGKRSAPHPVCGVLIIKTHIGLNLSRNRIIENFSQAEDDPTSNIPSEGGIILPLTVTGFLFAPEESGLNMVENEVVARKGPVLLFKTASIINMSPSNVPIRISGNRFIGNDSGTIVQIQYNGPVQCNNNTITCNLKSTTVDEVMLISATRITFNGNLCTCLGNLPVRSHVRLTGYRGVSATSNHCLAFKQRPAGASLPNSLHLSGGGGVLIAVANITTSGVVLEPDDPTNRLANVGGVLAET